MDEKHEDRSVYRVCVLQQLVFIARAAILDFELSVDEVLQRLQVHPVLIPNWLGWNTLILRVPEDVLLFPLK